MNERIKQLAEQAGVLSDFGEDIKAGRWGIGGSYQSMEKFAELIVQECVGVADTYIQTGEHARPTSRSTIGRLIKEHFGAEQ